MLIKRGRTPPIKTAAKSDADKQRLQRAIAATDRKIDSLVYELYGLTDEEIRVVEGT